MNPIVIYWLVLIVLTVLVVFLNAKYGLLRDESTLETKKPYSYARTQLTWWTVIVLSGFITIILSRFEIPTFTDGILVLLGISSVTTISARISDNSDQTKAETDGLIQNLPSQNFLLDILSDNNGVSIHRLQAVLFNISIGFWFIHESIINISNSALEMNNILPDLEMKNLILMGLSAGTYVTLKNKNPSTDSSSATVNKADTSNEIPPVG